MEFIITQLGDSLIIIWIKLVTIPLKESKALLEGVDGMQLQSSNMILMLKAPKDPMIKLLHDQIKLLVDSRQPH